MKFFKTFLSAALLFSAATLTTSLSAQTEKQYYATVEVEGEDTILYIRGYEQKPDTSATVLFVQEKELSTRTGSSKNLMDQSTKAEDLAKSIKRVKLEIDEDFSPQTIAYWFGYFYVEQIEGLENLKKIKNGSMYRTFYEMPSLKWIDLDFAKNIKVTNMQGVFNLCGNLEALDFSGVDMNKVTDIASAFNGCSNLKYIFCDEHTVFPEAPKETKYTFLRCSTLVGVAKNGNKVEYNAELHGGKEYVEQYFKTAEDGGFFTKINKAGDNEIGILPTKTQYNIGEELDLSGGYVTRTVEFGEGETYQIKLQPLKSLLSSVEGFDNTKIGKQTVSVTYGGKKIEFEVEVIGEIAEVSLVSEPNVNEYVMPITADSLDLSGGVIIKVYKSGDTVEYAMDALEFTVEGGLDGIKAGENTLVLSFDLSDTNFVWEYNINVLENAAEDSTGGGDEPGSGEEPGEGEGGEEPGSGDTPGSGEEPGEGEGGDEPGEGGEEGDDDPTVAAEDLVCGGAAFEAWTSGGVLYVSAARGGALEVLGVNGVLLRRISVAAGGSVSVVSEKGVYVLRMGGEVRKVVVE